MANPQKDAAIAELAEKFRSSSAAVITEYRGLTVAQLGELRDPRFGDRDDDAEPVLAGESLGEEHGACLCRGYGGSTVPGVGASATGP